MRKIIDEFTNLDIPNWQKFNLRHPERMKDSHHRYKISEKGRSTARENRDKNKKNFLHLSITSRSL